MWYFMGSLALELGKSMEEMMQMPIPELNFWVAFFKMREAKRKAAEQRARNKK